MPVDIQLSESTFGRLQALATPFVDTPASVIDRLLDQYDDGSASRRNLPRPAIRIGSTNRVVTKHNIGQSDPSDRDSRERGTVVAIDGTEIRAVSVSDLFEQAMTYLQANGHSNAINRALPIATSKRRYIIATRPVHPSGKDFVHPVKVNGWYMEAHKDYKNAIRQLQTKILDLLGIKLVYVS